jgi:hypothetical protein
MRIHSIVQQLGKQTGHHLAIVALALGVLFLNPTPVQAAVAVPFVGEFHNEIEAVINLPLASVTSTGAGHATLLGAMTTEAIEETVNLVTGEGVAQQRFTAANGDEIILDFHFWAIPDGPAFDVAGSWTISGGTGRFTGATGAGIYVGRVEFFGPTSATGQFRIEGTITSPGSLR